MLIVLCVLAVIAIHRIWHYEDIFAPLRATIVLDPAITPLIIAPVVFGASYIDHPAVPIIIAMFACYVPIRGAVWLYEKFDPQPKPGCIPCQQRAKDMAVLQERLRAWPKRVIVFGPVSLVNQLAQLRPKYLFITPEIVSPKKNILSHYLPDPIVQHLPFLIMQGGNATVVTVGVVHTPVWTDILTQMGLMRGVSWVHVTDQKVDVPAHHRVVAPGTPLDTVIDAAQPLG